MAAFVETICPGVTFTVEADHMLYAGRTDFQTVHVFEHNTLGRVLALDNVVQTTELDEFVYHEMLTHTPVFAHGAVRTALIIGGGDGGIARELLRHPVDRVVMVEIDGEVVSLCREHLPRLSNGAFDDPRLKLVIGDGARFVEDSDETFDVIIIDSTDPIGPGKVLFDTPFLTACRKRLRASGILVNQNGTPAFMPWAMEQSADNFAQVFPHSGFFYAPVPTYVSGVMALGWASEHHNLANVNLDAITARFGHLELSMRWYSPAVHVGAFAQPPTLASLARGAKPT